LALPRQARRREAATGERAMPRLSPFVMIGTIAARHDTALCNAMPERAITY